MDTNIFQTTSALSFNCLYVIESLIEKNGDKLTGTALLERLKPYADKCKISTARITVNTAQQWRDAMEFLRKKAIEGQRPIVHFEIHGTDNKDGLYINNGDIIYWQEVLQLISDINYASECNLLVSFAVCYGQYVAQYIDTFKRMPFCYSLGSFDVLYEDDLEERFFAFYKEFLTSFDFDKAYQALLDVREEMASNYCPFKADVLFARVMKQYLENQCTDTALKLRAESVMDANPERCGLFTEEQKKQFVEDFRKVEKQNREKYYQEYVENYFQLKRYPNNRNRFLIYNTTKELLNAFKTNNNEIDGFSEGKSL